jgi:tRNA modification GTPase
LLNRLVGRERALVSPEPGTTRDYLEERIIIGPHWLRLIDTAGLNPAPAALERQGIDKAMEQAVTADLFLWVVDSTRTGTPLPPVLARRMTAMNTVVVYNKTDLPAYRGSSLENDFPSVRVSALLGTDLEALQLAVTKLADSFQINVGDDLVAINARHSHSLEQGRLCLDSARDKLRSGPPSELVASDLRGALESFGQISGKIDNERVLDALFATFCIGK